MRRISREQVTLTRSTGRGRDSRETAGLTSIVFAMMHRDVEGPMCVDSFIALRGGEWKGVSSRIEARWCWRLRHVLEQRAGAKGCTQTVTAIVLAVQ